MSKIVIKKRVSLAFLGEEYAKAELVFRSIPIEDYEELIEKSTKADPDDAHASIGLTKDTLQKYFISGTFPNDAGELEQVTAEDILGLDKMAAVRCFEALTGQNLDPKADSAQPLETPSSTEAPLP